MALEPSVCPVIMIVPLPRLVNSSHNPADIGESVDWMVPSCPLTVTNKVAQNSKCCMHNNVYTILHTYARRFLSTPHSIAHTHPDPLSSPLVPIVTGIDGKGTSCQSSPSDSTISRIGQLTT